MTSASQKNTAIARQWHLGQPLLDMTANHRGTWCAGSLEDGRVFLLPLEDTGDDPFFFDVHQNGVSLELAPDADGQGFLSGGDDGCLYLVEPTALEPTLLAQEKGKWIEHVAGGAEGHRAYASGKTLYRLDEEGNPQGEPVTLPQSIGGLAFSPNGKRLAVSSYNALYLFWTHAFQTEPEKLEWKGSHLKMIFTPDGEILLSAMQDNSLHGWRLGAALKKAEAGNEMHMQGYEGKIRSMAFSGGGKYLCTGGAPQIVCWPFFDGGPWNKEPLTLGGTEMRLVSRVAPHPNDPMLAAGFDDGMIMLAPLDGRMEIMILPPVAAQGAAVIGLTWHHEGQSLVAGLENGVILLFTLASISRFVRTGI